MSSFANSPELVFTHPIQEHLAFFFQKAKQRVGADGGMALAPYAVHYHSLARNVGFQLMQPIFNICAVRLDTVSHRAASQRQPIKFYHRMRVRPYGEAFPLVGVCSAIIRVRRICLLPKS